MTGLADTDEDPLRRAGARRLLPAGAAVGGRLLPHRGAALGRQADARLAVQVLRLRGRGEPRSRSTGSPGPTGCAGSTSCTTSATASPRWSTSGQVEGGFVQGAGWLTLEDLRWDTATGRPAAGWPPRRPAPTSCRASRRCPRCSTSRCWSRPHEDGAVYGSKAVGEPPLMLAFSVREALREAVAAFGPAGHCVDLGCPSTPEQVFWAIAGAAPRGHVARRGARTGPRPPVARIAGAAAPEMHWMTRGRAAAPRAAARRARHRGGRARARAPGGRREDGGRRRERRWGTSAGATWSSRRVRAGARAARRGRPASRRPDVVGLTEQAPARHGVQCCGGEVTVLLEPLRRVPAVAIFGMGHVGCELARILARHDVELHLVDSRARAASSRAAGRAHRRRRGPGAHPPRRWCRSWCSASCPPAATCCS